MRNLQVALIDFVSLQVEDRTREGTQSKACTLMWQSPSDCMCLSASVTGELMSCANATL